MNKFNNFFKKASCFARKHFLWFILCSLALLVVALLTPMFHFKLEATAYGDRYHTIIDRHNVQYFAGQTVLFDLSYIINDFILSIIAINIILLIVFIFRKKSLYLSLSCICSIITFILAVVNFAQNASEHNYAHIDTYYEETLVTIPHVSFFILLIFFIASILSLISILFQIYKRKQPKKTSDSDRIAELEKKVAELEAQKQSESPTQSKDGE